MSKDETPRDWSLAHAPGLEDFEAIGRTAYDGLPAEFRRLIGDVLIRVADFPEDDVLDELGIESEFGLLGLFQGVGLAHAASTPV
ncbi:MAG: metallopeptidase family protein, partial [Rhizobiales bacterium]|nr:metallopeptidase family protein [Hyphomicrobiales bacterium]